MNGRILRITAKSKSLGYDETIRIYENDLYLLEEYLRHWELNELNSRVYGLVLSSTFEDTRSDLHSSNSLSGSLEPDREFVS